MLEETNRIITDHISDYLFAPTKNALKNLKIEGISSEKVFFTGNTVVDAFFQNFEISEKKVNVLKRLELKKDKYILVTAHRAENVDVEKRLKGIVHGLKLVSQDLKIPIIYPIHPRTKNSIKNFNIKVPGCIKLTKPIGYLEFIQLESNAFLIITDSGGLQEEACILKVPCITIRENTERPETIKAGVNILAGTDPQKILKSVQKMLKIKSKKDWINPFGDGRAAEKILDNLISSKDHN
jgi:UDP-N-acetylglucosamine 2-epimerase (non-hydrolysing)